MKTLANLEDKQNTLERLARVQPDHRAHWGRMSAHQMLCHLNDSFLAVMGEKYVSPASGPLQRTVVKWVALYTPIPWPKGVPTRQEMDQLIGGTGLRGRMPTCSGLSTRLSLRRLPIGAQVINLPYTKPDPLA